LSISPEKKNGAGGGIRTPDQLITNQLLWPAELHRHIFSKNIGIAFDAFLKTGVQM
jgi:hypothetical protein